MIKVQGKIPRDVGVAVSGGIDSMVILNFLRRNHNVTAYNFDHGTKFGGKAADFVISYCKQANIPYKLGHIKNYRPKGVSKEEHWRNERYAWLTEQDQTIVLGHHLDDCLESYVFNMCNGKDYTIPYRHANCIRPFRLNKKDTLAEWALNNLIIWIEDPSNNDYSFRRNHIRCSVLPSVLKVNPGFYKIIAKRLAAEEVE